MENNIPRILKSSLFVSILFIPLLQCALLYEWTSSMHLYGIMWIANYCVAIYTLSKSTHTINKNVWFIVSVFIWLFLITVINQSCEGIFIRTVGCISFFLVADFYLQKLPETYFQGLLNIAIIIMIVQFVSLLLNFHGFDFEDTFDEDAKEKVFFKAKNFAPYFYLAFMCISYFVKSIFQKYSFRCYILIALCIICGVLQWSGTGVFGIVSFLLIAETTTRLKAMRNVYGKIFTGKKIIIASVFVTLFLFGSNVDIPIVRWITEDVLHKDATFSGRTELWGLGIMKFLDNPVLGLGSNESGRIPVLETAIITHSSHNMYIELLIQGGAIAFLLFIIWYIKSLLCQTKSDVKLNVLLLSASFLLFVMYQFEGLPYDVFPFVIIMLNNYPIISNQKKNKRYDKIYF